MGQEKVLRCRSVGLRARQGSVCSGAPRTAANAYGLRTLVVLAVVSSGGNACTDGGRTPPVAHPPGYHRLLLLLLQDPSQQQAQAILKFLPLMIGKREWGWRWRAGALRGAAEG